MHAKVLISIFLVFASTVFGQSLDELKVATKKIYDANYTMDFEAVSALTYPKIVTHFGKSQFLDKLDSDYQNDKYRMRIQMEMSVFQYGEIFEVDNTKYCVVSYKNPARYFFETKLDSNTSLIEANFLREKDQTKDVTFEPKRNSFNVRRISKLIAIADESTGFLWKFFNLDDVEQRSLYNTYISETVRERLVP